MIEWIVFGLFVLITISLLSGKGAWLIAGYNTMSKEEKESFDKKKLSKSAGVLFLFIDVELLIMNILMNTGYGTQHESAVVFGFLGILCITVFIGIVYINKNALRK